jgi:hypothetical protein
MAAPDLKDLGALVSEFRKRAEITLSLKPPESKAEREHRHALTAAEARFERTKDLIVLVAVLLGVGVVLILCLWLAAGSNSSPEDKKWATAILASVVTSGLVILPGSARRRNSGPNPIASPP